MNLAVTRAFDAVLVVHAVAAICALVVLAVLRAAAAVVQGPPPLSESAARSFTGRPDYAARVVHLVPLTGLAVLAVADGSYSVRDWFVPVGIALWVVAAVCLEAVALPAQRHVAAALRDGETPVASARRMAMALDAALAALVIAAIVMIAAQR